MSRRENRGTSFSQKIDLAGKTGRMTKLSFKLTSLDVDRSKLMERLGTEVYEEVRALPELAQKHNEVLTSIAELDAQRADLQQQIDSLKVMMREIKTPASADSALEGEARLSGEYYTCPRCGTAVAATDKFCSGCGLLIDEVRGTVPGGEDADARRRPRRRRRCPCARSAVPPFTKAIAFVCRAALTFPPHQGSSPCMQKTRNQGSGPRCGGISSISTRGYSPVAGCSLDLSLDTFAQTSLRFSWNNEFKFKLV